MKKEVYSAYCPDYNKTFIMEACFTDDGDLISLEVKGFYHGEPNELDNKTFYGDLRADFSDPEVQENAED